MKTIYIIRHAKSSWDDPDLSDFQRPLNERGKRDAPRMGKRLKEKDLHPDVVLSSPARRALSTAKRICKEIGFEKANIRTDRRLYHADEEAILAVLREIRDKHDLAFIFGHNPGLTDFVNLIARDDTEANAKGKGVIFLTCHVGAFDLQVSTMALKGLNPNIIGTPLKDERLNELLWEYRNKYGAVAIERGKETFRLIKVLKSGGSVALLIDQDTRVKSTFVDFFGIPASTPVGVTVLALKTGAAVVPTYIHLGKDWKQHMVILPEVQLTVTGNEEVDIHQNTQMLTNLTESIIRKHPEQWVWMHERWKTRPGDVG